MSELEMALAAGTVSLTSFDGHCVRVDFTTRDDAQRFFEALLASVDTLPKGQDAQQGLAGTESGAVGNAETPNPTPDTGLIEGISIFALREAMVLRVREDGGDYNDAFDNGVRAAVAAFDAAIKCTALANAAPAQVESGVLRSKLADWLNAFKADPFSTGDSKVDRLLEVIASRPNQATKGDGL